jgi:hypothetical protein
MSSLDRAISALNVLGSVVQAVPIVGDGLKSATEVASKICETVKVRTPPFLSSICLNPCAEDKRQPRGVRATGRACSSVARGCREHHIKGQPGEVGGNGGQRRAAAPVRSRHHRTLSSA